MLAALGIALSPYFLRPGGMLQPVVFEQLWWTLALLALAIRIRDDDPKHWLGIGFFLGLASLTKFSVAFLAAGFIAALLLTTLRRDLTTKWPYVACIIATTVGHPSISGQILLRWPVTKQFADLRAGQLSTFGPLDFLTGQLAAGPVLFLAIGGMVWLIRSATNPPDADRQRRLPDYRPIAVVTATAFLILFALRGKAYYIAPVYPVLVAAGAAGLDALSVRIAPSRPTKVLAVAAAAVALYGMVTLPFGLPLLAPPEMSQVSELLGAQNRSNTGDALSLPQDYADMLGWPELAQMTALVWHALPPSDTANAVLIGTNYGRAGALDLFGGELGLPSTISAAGVVLVFWTWHETR